MQDNLAIVSMAALLVAVAPRVEAQRCIGLPDRQHIAVAAGFEGTDGLSGVSAALSQFYERWGVQLRFERYDDQPREDAWYGKEAQAVTRVGPSLFSPHCVFAAIRFHDGGAGSIVYHRTRMPAGYAFGRTFGPEELQWTVFAQPALVLQWESTRDMASVDTRNKLRTQIAPATTIGLSAVAGRFLARTYVHYAHFPDNDTVGRHNWPELTVHFGWIFPDPADRDDP